MASRIATANMMSWWESIYSHNYNCDMIMESIKAHIEKTNIHIINLSRQKNIKMATTLSALAVYQNQCVIAHIGDSRIYRFGSGMLGSHFQMLTKDHSCFINTQIGGQTVRKNVFTECLGYKETINVDFSVLALNKGDIYVLCSDGVYKTIPNENLKKIINTSPDMLTLCHNIIYQAKLNNEKDNISVIAIQIR